MATRKLKKEIIETPEVEKEVESEVIIEDEVIETTEKEFVGVSVNVLNSTNQVVRVYSKEIHGDDFMKLAVMFANKNGYTLK